jgi:hypothetical protein
MRSWCGAWIKLCVGCATQQFEASPPVHLSFQLFQARDLSLDLPLTVVYTVPISPFFTWYCPLKGGTKQSSMLCISPSTGVRASAWSAFTP